MGRPAKDTEKTGGKRTTDKENADKKRATTKKKVTTGGQSLGGRGGAIKNRLKVKTGPSKIKGVRGEATSPSGKANQAVHQRKGGKMPVGGKLHGGSHVAKGGKRNGTRKKQNSRGQNSQKEQYRARVCRGAREKFTTSTNAPVGEEKKNLGRENSKGVSEWGPQKNRGGGCPPRKTKQRAKKNGLLV